MKKLLSITLLIIAVLLGSCKEESSISRIEKGTTKKVKALSYTFNSTQNEDGGTVKSGTSTDSTKVVSPIERKVISVDTWEEGGETFVASLIEENDPIATKAPTQEVNGSSVYTFYAYKDSKIKLQTVAPKGTFDVPVDEATNYGMIFLSSAKGMENPKQLTPTTIDESKKEITYNAKFNENVCYASFDKVKMPPGNPIDVTFTPVFSQLGIYVPSKVTGTTITVNKVRLVSGGQNGATVKVVYNSKATNNITVSYNNLANYAVDLTHKLNPIDNITYLYPNGKQGYYNIIPNKKTAKVDIEMTATGIKTPMKKTIDFKVPFSCGKRYTIKITNGVTPKIEVEPATTTLKYGLTKQLKATALVYPDGTREPIPQGAVITWEANNGGGVTTNGLATIAMVGTTTFTAKYNGAQGTATIVPDIHKTFKATDYYQWDAYAPYNPAKYNDYSFGSGLSGYNPITTGVANHSCAGAPSYADAKTYLGNGVKWSETDGLIFTVEPDATSGKKLYCSGLWLKKRGSAGWNPSASAEEVNYTYADHGRPSNSVIGNYFFLHAYGNYDSGICNDPGVFGDYWTSTPSTALDLGTISAYHLGFTNQVASVHTQKRNLGCVPMVGFDDIKGIELTPIDTENLDASYTAGNYVYKFGLQHKFKAEAVYSDNSRMEITTSAAWSANGATSNGGGVVTITSETPATVTATFRGKSANVTIKPLVWKRFTVNDFYQWDAWSSYDVNAKSKYNLGAYQNAPWRSGCPGYHEGAGATASQSCRTAPSAYEAQYYLGDERGVYLSLSDGPIFTTADGTGKLYCAGVWFRRRNLCSGTRATSASKIKDGRPENISEYFFSPATGYYESYNSGILTNPGFNCHFWLSTPGTDYTNDYTANHSYALRRGGDGIKVVTVHRSYGFLILSRESDYYVN